MKYQILRATRNSGVYEGGTVLPLRTAQNGIRADRPGRRLLWREEGGDICAYLCREDMDDEDKAIARLRPA